MGPGDPPIDPRDIDIDVIVRTGGRAAALLERAIGSLARQTAGRIRVLLVRHGPADAEALQRLIGGALHSVHVIDAPGANRGRAMAAGLDGVLAPYFAFLDDDDYLLDTHFEGLLAALKRAPGSTFAYSDILAQDEGSGPGEGLRVWREGPAQPPLGHITDRISVHAFLAERSLLQGVPYARWGLSTAEDALLIASLLARGTPVHAPHATCVYVQGGADASAYLTHPDRAADELTFAREIAPLRAAIEARFGASKPMDEATYLAPFVDAARHAELFAGLRQRSAGSAVAAIRSGALAVPVAGNPALAAMAAPLAFEAVSGTVRAAEGGGVEIEAGQDYAFAARLPLDLVTTARPAIVAIRIGATQGRFGLALAGADHALRAEARVEAVPGGLEVQLIWENPEPPVLIVRRLAASGGERPFIGIDAIAIAFPCAALAPEADRADAEAALATLARTPRAIRSHALAQAPPGEGHPALGAAEIGLGDAPWAYAFSAPLPAEAARAALRVNLGPADAAVYVLRVDETWAAVGERLEVPATSRPSTVWLEPLAEGAAARLVLQAGAAPCDRRVSLRGVFLYPESVEAGASA